MTSSNQKENSKQNELIAQIQKKDIASMTELYKDYSPALFNIILSIIKQEEIAKEILQDTFLKIWQHSASFDTDKGRLFTWMARIARNTTIDRIRSKNYKSGKRIFTVGQNSDLQNKKVFKMDLADIGLKNTISKLDKKYEEVLLALFIMGHTQKQASKKLNISLGTVKSRSRRGLQIMQHLLKSERYLHF